MQANEYAGVRRGLAVEDGKLVSGMVQDCDPIAEDAKARHASGMMGSRDIRHVARVPLVMVEKYCNDHGLTFEQFCVDPTHKKRLLEDPALAYFRIWKGAL